MQEYINTLDTENVNIRVVELSGQGLFVVTSKVINTLKVQLQGCRHHPFHASPQPRSRMAHKTGLAI